MKTYFGHICAQIGTEIHSKEIAGRHPSQEQAQKSFWADSLEQYPRSRGFMNHQASATELPASLQDPNVVNSHRIQLAKSTLLDLLPTLVERSFWFEVTPLSDILYALSIKAEDWLSVVTMLTTGDSNGQ